ncbi:MAG: hypothetical protein ACI4MJ_02245 [Aristaeellaceae bacterium]
MLDLLLNARAMLDTLTPLHTDCGSICACRCCSSVEGEETGMLLFPGEEALYAALPGYRLLPTAHGTLLICPGQCQRSDRPLSCRLFPLLPVVRQDGVKVAMDQRAKGICPLARQGTNALREEFVSTVREVGRMLCQEPAQRAFLEQLTRQQDELRALRSQFGGNHHV